MQNDLTGLRGKFDPSLHLQSTYYVSDLMLRFTYMNPLSMSQVQDYMLRMEGKSSRVFGEMERFRAATEKRCWYEE